MILVSHLVVKNYEYYVIYVSLDDAHRVHATAVVVMVTAAVAAAVYLDRINRLVVFHSHPSFVAGFSVLVDLAAVIDCKPLTQHI